MRTTVTLDKDVERSIHELMHKTRKSFKQTLNDLLRAALTGGKTPPKKPFKVDAQPMGFRPGIDPAGFNKLVDDLEIDDFIEKNPRS